MMKTGHGIEVLDPYEWLPGYGENTVKIATEGTELVVAVTYDRDAEVRGRVFRFTSVCSFYWQAFPGPSLLDVEGGDAALLLRGVLVEYPDSEAAMAWSRHFGNSREVRHYSILFSAENRLLVVLAGEVSLKESA